MQELRNDITLAYYTFCFLDDMIPVTASLHVLTTPGNHRAVFLRVVRQYRNFESADIAYSDLGSGFTGHHLEKFMLKQPFLAPVAFRLDKSPGWAVPNPLALYLTSQS